MENRARREKHCCSVRKMLGLRRTNFVLIVSLFSRQPLSIKDSRSFSHTLLLVVLPVFAGSIQFLPFKNNGFFFFFFGRIKCLANKTSLITLVSEESFLDNASLSVLSDLRNNFLTIYITSRER